MKSGDYQWMMSGSGIIHQEMPLATHRFLGGQIWLNMPRKDKVSQPQYGDILDRNASKIIESNAVVEVISGDYLK